MIVDRGPPVQKVARTFPKGKSMYRVIDLEIKAREDMKNEKYIVQNMLEKNNWLSSRDITLTNYLR